MSSLDKSLRKVGFSGSRETFNPKSPTAQPSPWLSGVSCRKAWQGFRKLSSLGFRALGFRVVGFRVLGLGSLGFRVWGTTHRLHSSSFLWLIFRIL